MRMRGLGWGGNVISPISIDEAARIVRGSGLKVPALVRGGFFPAVGEPDRLLAIEDNKRCIDEASALGAEMVVLVCGAVPGMPLDEARAQIHLSLSLIEPYARANGVRLAIEPLHPMYAADRSAINRMKEARLACEAVPSTYLGIALDVYHVWWDPDLADEIARAGANGTLFAYHVCDWKPNTTDLLNDRGLMGEGCIDLKGIRRTVEAAGFGGMIEVEIFSNRHWARDQNEYLADILQAYQTLV